MGSCLSKKEREKPPSSSHSCCRDPPPDSDSDSDSPMEEKVKEVLSETPNLNKVTTSRDDATKDDDEINNSSSNDGKEKEKEIKEKKKDDRSEDTWEVYSVSETFSASTPVPEETTEETKKKKKRSDKEEEDHQLKRKRRVDRSPASYQRKRSVSAGELHPAPPKKVSDHRGVGIGCRSGRSSSPNSVRGETLARNNHRVSACEKFRRDHGEISERRSVSPASKRPSPLASVGQCRSLSASRANGHRIHARLPAPDVPSNGNGDGDQESLENPLVSLECFIFL